MNTQQAKQAQQAKLRAEKLYAEVESLYKRLGIAAKAARAAGDDSTYRRIVNVQNKVYWRWVRRHDRLGIAHYMAALAVN